MRGACRVTTATHVRSIEDDGSGPRFGDAPLPEGIDCQRCHGPGQAHVEAVKSGDKKAIVLAIVNPARLDRDRQLEACMQCHLESTSSPLPFRIQRYEQPPVFVHAREAAERLLHSFRSRARHTGTR